MSDTQDLPVTLLPADLYKCIVSCSKEGLCKLDDSTPLMSSTSLFDDMAKHPEKYTEYWKTALADAGLLVGGLATSAGSGLILLTLGPLGPIAIVGAVIAAPFFSKNRVATLVIGNGTTGDMKQSGSIYQDCGWQAGRPVYKKVDPDTGVEIATKKNTIPGYTEVVEGFPMWGVGMYRFEKDLSALIGFYGTGGAIAFEFTSKKVNTTMAVSWLVPEKGKPALGVTADLSKYGDSLETFYDKTAGARKTDRIDIIDGGPRIRGQMMFREYPGDKNEDDLVFTFTVDE